MSGEGRELRWLRPHFRLSTARVVAWYVLSAVGLFFGVGHGGTHGALIGLACLIGLAVLWLGPELRAPRRSWRIRRYRHTLKPIIEQWREDTLRHVAAGADVREACRQTLMRMAVPSRFVGDHADAIAMFAPAAARRVGGGPVKRAVPRVPLLPLIRAAQEAGEEDYARELGEVFQVYRNMIELGVKDGLQDIATALAQLDTLEVPEPCRAEHGALVSAFEAVRDRRLERARSRDVDGGDAATEAGVNEALRRLQDLMRAAVGPWHPAPVHRRRVTPGASTSTDTCSRG